MNFTSSISFSEPTEAGCSREEKESEAGSGLPGKACHILLVTFVTGVRGERQHPAIYFSSSKETLFNICHLHKPVVLGSLGNRWCP